MQKLSICVRQGGGLGAKGGVKGEYLKIAKTILHVCGTSICR